MNKENYIDLDRGLYIGKNEEGSILIDWKDLAGHLLITGDTRVGKTRLLASMIRQCILKGYNLMIFDPKGSSDNEMMSWVNEFAIEANRQDDINYINPMNLDNSLKFNPLYNLNNEEISSLVSTLIPAKDDFYIVMGYTVTFSILAAFEFIETYAYNKFENIPLRKLVTFEDIQKFILKSKMKELLEIILSINNNEIGFENMKIEVIRMLEEQVKKDQSYYDKVSMSLNNLLMDLTTGDVGNILCTEKTNPILNLLKYKSSIIIIQPYPLKYKRSSDLLVRIIFSSIIESVKDISSIGEQLKKELYLFIDDGGSILFPGIEHLFNRAGGMSIRIIIASQEFNLYDESLGEEISKIITDNINTKIYMKNSILHERRNTYIGSMLDMQVSENHFKLDREIKELAQKEFIINSKSNLNKGFVMNQKDPQYLVDINNHKSYEINDLFDLFKDNVKDKKLQLMVNQGLLELSKYDFKKEPSIKENFNIENKYLFNKVSKNPLLFEKINIKDHTLNRFLMGIIKLKRIKDHKLKKEKEIVVVAALFLDFGRMKDIINKVIEIDDERSNWSDKYFSKEYIAQKFKNIFKEEDDTLERLNRIVSLGVFTPNKLKNDDNLRFLDSIEYKCRMVELDILNKKFENNNKKSIREEFRDILYESQITFNNEKREHELFLKKKINENKFQKTEKKYLIYKDERLIESITKENISHISFRYQPTKYNNEYKEIIISMNNGHSICIEHISKEDMEFFLEE